MQAQTKSSRNVLRSAEVPAATAFSSASVGRRPRNVRKISSATCPLSAILKIVARFGEAAFTRFTTNGSFINARRCKIDRLLDRGCESRLPRRNVFRKLAVDPSLLGSPGSGNCIASLTAGSLSGV